MTSTPTAPTAAALLAELRGLGVELWRDGARLRFRAPRGALTDAHRERLGAHRDELLDTLDAEAAPPDLVPCPDDAALPFPLTDVQAAYLIGRTTAVDWGGIACHGYVEVDLGVVAPADVAVAWNALVARHGMLRAVIDPAGSARVLPQVPELPVGVTDLTGAEPADVDLAVAAARARMDHAEYDQSRWPLHALHLTRTDTGTVAHLSVDLIVADFASVQLLLGELGALLRGEEPAPLDISFRDYVLAARGLADTPRRHRDRTYWLERVDALPPAPELPRDGRAAPVSVDGPVRFRRLQQSLTEPEWAAVRAGAARHGLTSSAVVLAAFAEVIGRWSANPRFTLDLPLQNRLALHDQVCGLAGDFTTVGLLAVDTTEPLGFAERARELSAQLLTDLDHRLFSGVEVLREIARRRGRDAALMPVVFTGVLAADGGGAGEIRYGISQTPQVWIDCQAVDSSRAPRGGGLLVSWDVRRGALDDGLVDAAFGALLGVLRRLAADPDAWDRPAPVELPAAQRATRAAANATAAPRTDGLLHEPWLAAARASPQAPAIVAADGALTHGELLARASAVAAHLGPQHGALVAIEIEKSLAQIVAVLGVMLAGGAYLPLDPAQPAPRRAVILGDADVHTVLDAPAVERILGADPGVVPVSGAAPDDLAYVIHTSGSTGRPKGVMISHRAARTTVDDMTARFGIGPGDRVLGLAQLGFDLSVYDIFGVLGAGGTLVLPDPDRRADPSHWVELVRQHGVTLWNSVPAQAQMLADHARDARLPSVRHVWMSGDWIPVGLPARLREIVPGAALTSLGGATEAAIWSIQHPIGEVPDGAVSIPYGRPLTNQRFSVLDGSFRDRPDLVPGELHIGGDGLAMGYLGDPGLTAARFLTHPATGERLYRTGDTGRYLPGGEIEFLGRTDDQVKIRGHRIELAEVEAALASAPGVAAGAVAVVGEGPLHRRLAGFVVPASGSAAPLDAPAAAAAGAEVERAVAPERIAGFVDSLDDAELVSALAALRADGLFAAHTDAHSADDIETRVRVAPRHRVLLHRWLAVLVAEGLLTLHDGRYRATSLPGPAARTAAWAAVRAAWSEELSPPAVLDYLGAHATRFGELLRGELDPVGLLFPSGDPSVAAAAYADTLIARYLNRVTAEVVRQVAGHGPRVLEVGAGVGATTAQVLAALGDTPVDYLFTDLSRYFLNRAATEFPGVRTALLDLDDLTGPAQPHDVIIAAGVLNNVRDIPRTVHGLVARLAPGGTIVITEPTREHHEVLGSQAFMMSPAQDARAGSGATFLTRTQWAGVLTSAGLSVELTLPADGSPLDPLGQHVIVARRAAGVDVDVARAHVAGLVPAHMVPPTVQVIDAIPLTGNGKVDRSRLAALADPPEPAAGGPMPGDTSFDELEALIAAVLEATAGLAVPARDTDLFGLGFDSLLLAQAAGRLVEEPGVPAGHRFDEVLRQLLTEPTVAALAAHLRGATPSDVAIPPRPGALLDLGGVGTGPATVLVGAGPWDASLVARLGGPVHGLDSGAVGEAPTAEPAGPTRIVGRGPACAAAIELAAAMAERGVPAVAVVLIDPDEPPPGCFYAGSVTVLTTAGIDTAAWRAVVLAELDVVVHPEPGSPDALLAALAAS